MLVKKMRFISGFFGVYLLTMGYGFSAASDRANYSLTDSVAGRAQPNHPAAPIEPAVGPTHSSLQSTFRARSHHIPALISLGETQYNQGEYRKAENSLGNALQLARDRNDRFRMAAALGVLGNVYVAMGRWERAQNTLIRAEAMSRELNQPALTAAILINLGNFHVFRREFQRAGTTFEQSIRYSKRAGNPLLIAQGQTNAARNAVNAQQIEQSDRLLEAAQRAVSLLDDSRTKALLSLNLAKSFMRFNREATSRDGYSRRALGLLWDADRIFRASNDLVGVSYAQGLLGELYEQEGQFTQALQLSRKAAFRAQQIDNKYLMFRWLWQKARIFSELRNFDQALDSYRKATALLGGLRHQMAIAYETEGLSFQEAVLPAYSQFIDLLLKNAEAANQRDTKDTLLIEVRDTVEKLKAAEIRDYFGDQCVDALRAKRKPVWKASTSALIVYPIPLKNRTELLLDFPDGSIQQLTVPVGREELTGQIRRFRSLLEKKTTNEYRIPGQQLYRWLIGPIATVLAGKNIDTLVFVPDGALLTIPMAALYDGKKHLIEKYAVAITPGVELTDPRPLASDQIKPLLGGLSESVEGYPALAHVKDELQEIQRLHGGEMLLDQQFRHEQLRTSLHDKQLNVLHISTHGVLGKNIDESFLLTFDGRLSIDRLADYVGMFKFRENPLELIVLSACETAQSEDRAALGLSGIAVKAGARSALGTLWKVNDLAAAQMMQEFYRQLKQGRNSRATALQKAQRGLLEDLRYRHPAYWSAFLLINNWL